MSSASPQSACCHFLFPSLGLLLRCSPALLSFRLLRRRRFFVRCRCCPSSAASRRRRAWGAGPAPPPWGCPAFYWEPSSGPADGRRGSAVQGSGCSRGEPRCRTVASLLSYPPFCATCGPVRSSVCQCLIWLLRCPCRFPSSLLLRSLSTHASELWPGVAAPPFSHASVPPENLAVFQLVRVVQLVRADFIHLLPSHCVL